jgi:diacylglycerol kinase family enzyme
MPARRERILSRGGRIPQPSPVDTVIPLFVNDRSGRAGELCDALGEVRGLGIRRLAPEEIAEQVAREIEAGTARIAVAGGDGTISTAAAHVAGREVELAVIPGGTLNHFAGDLGIPADLAEASALATNGGAVALVDVGRVSGRLMLNTSSIGLYSAFVRDRDRIERRLGYRLASMVAATRLLARLRSVRVELEVEGKVRIYHTPLLFVGVGEREIRVPMLGARVKNGRRQLHLFVVRRRSAWGLIALAVVAAFRGSRDISRTTHVDAFLVDHFRVHTHRRTVVAIDGELVTLDSPLEYRIERDALRVVVPRADG